MTYSKLLHEIDSDAWFEEQAQLLRDHLDLEHLIEEVEELGKSEQRAVKSRLAKLGPSWRWFEQSWVRL